MGTEQGRRVGRRDFIIGVAAMMAALVSKRTCESGIRPPEQASTVNPKMLIEQWEKEAAKNPGKTSLYTERIVDLAVDVFCDEMGYSKESLKSRISILEKSDYVKKLTECGEKFNPNVFTVTDLFENKAYFNKEPGFFIDRPHVYMIFMGAIHELFHLAPERKTVGQNIYRKGLLEIHKEGSKQDRCSFRNYFIEFEETVVQDAAERLVLKTLGFQIKEGRSKYDELVVLYRRHILSFYGGDDVYKELLSFQQKSDLEGFFQSIGIKLGGKNQLEQIGFGKAHLDSVFVGKSKGEK